MIEILVVRDPDMADDITVWVDGRPATHEAHIAYVDAGAGYEYEDWRDNADWVLRNGPWSHAAFQAIEAAFEDPPGKDYIDGWPYEEKP